MPDALSDHLFKELVNTRDCPAQNASAWPVGPVRATITGRAPIAPEARIVAGALK
jgi:hypothetical protein